jgi:hypothetical protein
MHARGKNGSENSGRPHTPWTTAITRAGWMRDAGSDRWLDAFLQRAGSEYQRASTAL